VTRCNVMEFTKRFSVSPKSGRDVTEEEVIVGSVEDKILDFLHGITHGEELLHALYDRVLDEPIPQRMRALFKERENGTGRG
jgi:hypothetical protein